MIPALQDTLATGMIAIKAVFQALQIKDYSVGFSNMEEELAIHGNLETASTIEECSEDVKLIMGLETVKNQEQ